MRTVFRYWLTLLVVAVIAQIAGAAYGAFYAAQKLGDQKGPDEQKLISAKAFDHGFGFHVAFGYIIFLGTIVLLLFALAAKVGKRRILFAGGTVLAVAVQIALAWASESAHAVGILHGINALVVLGLVGSQAGEEWRAQRAPTAPAT